MDKSTKRIIVIGCLVCFVVLPLGISLWAVYSSQHQAAPQVTTVTPPQRTDTELLSAITTSLPAYVDSNGKPLITIIKTTHPQPNWYIVTMKLISDSSDNYAKVLINDPYTSDKGLHVILGPGTSFSSDDTAGKGVPDSVLKELNS